MLQKSDYVVCQHCISHIVDIFYILQEYCLQPSRRNVVHTKYSICFSIFPCAKSLSCVQLFVTLQTIARQAPLSMGFSRQEHQSGLPFPSPGDLSDPGIEPASLKSPALTGFCTTNTTWEAPVFPSPLQLWGHIISSG